MAAKIVRKCEFCGRMIEADTPTGLESLMITHSKDCRDKMFSKETYPGNIDKEALKP